MKCIFNGHHVTNVSLVFCYFVEKSGTLRTHIGHMIILNQTPTNKLHLSAMKNITIVVEECSAH